MNLENAPRDWLVVRLSALGDVVLTTGVLEHLHRTLGWRFHFLTRAAFAPVLLHNPVVEKITVPDEKTLAGVGWLTAANRLANLYRGWGLLDLHGTLRSRALRLFWSGPVAGYPKFSLDRRLHGATKLQGPRLRLEAMNVPQRYARAVLDTAPDASELRPVIHLADEERAWAEAKLAEVGVTSDAPLAVLHPYATHTGKQWPEEHWPALAEALEAAGWQWLVVGKSKTRIFDHERDLSDRTNIRQTCALLEKATALVTGDSGPMHLGTAVNTPVVALFGPTTRAWGFFPTGERDTVLERDLPCRPCHVHGGRGGCRHGEACMRDISVDEVLAAVTRLKE